MQFRVWSLMLAIPLWLVGDTGRVVPPQDPEALAAAWKAVIRLGHEGLSDLGAAARSRVMRRYSLASVVEQYESLYQTVIAEGIPEQSFAEIYLSSRQFTCAGRISMASGRTMNCHRGPRDLQAARPVTQQTGRGSATCSG